MTGPENERLAVLESKFEALQSDVSEIKSDVKALVHTQITLATALAVKDEAEKARLNSRASTGVWVRAMIPWVIALAGFVMALLNTIERLHPA